MSMIPKGPTRAFRAACTLSFGSLIFHRTLSLTANDKKQSRRDDFDDQGKDGGFFEDVKETFVRGRDAVKKVFDDLDTKADEARASVETLYAAAKKGSIGKNVTEDIVQQAWKHSGSGVFHSSSRETVLRFYKQFNEFSRTMEEKFGSLDFSGLDPTAIYYYIEHEDARKHPSWKRRVHRYMTSVDTDKVESLHDALNYAEVAYADSEEQVELGLETLGSKWALETCDIESMPGQPSHFSALKTGQSKGAQTHVMIVVRGTKTVADFLTDAMLDTKDFRGGKGHAGILDSGKWLLEQYEDKLESLRQESPTKTLHVSFIGHSLGAGASTIAAMKLKEKSGYQVDVVGLGCPAMLSKELSESCKDFVTTLVCDSDLIVRMSAESICNLIQDITEQDWSDLAVRDIDDLIKHVDATLPIETKLTSRLDRMLDDIRSTIKSRVKKKTTKRMKVVLFPPGELVHIYRDGSSVSGTIVPCTFFDEIEFSRSMMDDHSIDGYEKLFLQMLRDKKQDNHFRFEHSPVPGKDGAVVKHEN